MTSLIRNHKQPQGFKLMITRLIFAGGGTILPSNTRGPRTGASRGTGTGQARMPAPTMTGPHIHAGGDPSQATHFGSIVPGWLLCYTLQTVSNLTQLCD